MILVVAKSQDTTAIAQGTQIARYQSSRRRNASWRCSCTESHDTMTSARLLSQRIYDDRSQGHPDHVVPRARQKCAQLNEETIVAAVFEKEKKEIERPRTQKIQVGPKRDFGSWTGRRSGRDVGVAAGGVYAAPELLLTGRRLDATPSGSSSGTYSATVPPWQVVSVV